jgi:hypothetical protein
MPFPRAIKLLLCFLFLCSATLFAIDREAFTFTHYDLEVKIDGPLQAFMANGKVVLRNDSAAPQRLAVLQISSTLEWRSVKSDGKPVQYFTQGYTSDADHTGKLSEAIVTLPHEVPPQKSIELEISYEGTIPADSTRLGRIGVPAEVAARNDWDRISPQVTAVRGIGYVAWYPIALEALNLSDDPRMFSLLNAWKERHQDSSMRVNLCTEVDEPNPPTLIMNSPQRGVQGGSVAGTAHGTTTACRENLYDRLGLTVPTFAMANYVTLDRPAISVYYLPVHKLSATDYALAAESVLPFSTQWFGKPKQKVVVIDLDQPGAAPFESGPLLFTPLGPMDQKRLQLTLIHQLVHAAFYSSRPWIYEGLAHFAQALEREQQEGRKAALAYMEAYRPALVQAEKPAAPGPGQPLVTATDEIFYRTKSMFVWWMLRDMLGDDLLQRALQAYRPDQDREPSYIQRLLGRASRRDLEWFFDAWVYRDRGLPDFRVESAYPRQMVNGGFLVTVTVENLGNAAAEVPVFVHAGAGENSQRVMVAGKGKGVARILLPVPPVEATVNDGSVPETDISNDSLKIVPPEKSQ